VNQQPDPLSQFHILAEVKPGHVALPGDLYSLSMAADFYETTINNLKQVIRRYGAALERDGLRYLTRDEAIHLLNAAPLGAYLCTTMPRVRVLTARCMLRLGLLLKRSEVARMVAKQLGQIPRGRDGYRVTEQETLSVIIAAIQPLLAQREFSVGTYSLDLYLPELRLAVECDEGGHGTYGAAKEREREQFVKDALGCSFLRFNPDAPSFNLGDVINSILTTGGGARAIALPGEN
jgi:very-short-patch-repair endonuclease